MTFEGTTRLAWLSTESKTKRGTQFERFLCWWFREDPEMQVAFGFTRVVLLAEWPDNPFRGDVGIDLIAWDRNHGLWGIQAKAYEASSRVGLDPIAKLAGVAIPVSAGGQFTGRIVVSTTEGFTQNAKDVAERNGIVLIDRDRIFASEIDFPNSEAQLLQWLVGGGPPRTRPVPRPHQRRAIDAVLEGLRDSSRGQLVMACGTGKTLTSLWIKEELARFEPGDGNSLVLLLFPSISLLEQSLREWASNRATDWTALAVCSDESVTSPTDDMPEDLKVVDSGLPATTDLALIRRFLDNCAGERIIFSTYQSSAVVAAAARERSVVFDLVICDEAHRLAGTGDRAFSVVLHDDQLPARRRLFMTATPRIFTEAAKSKAESNDAVVLSMDDLNFFGPTLFSYPFGEAIQDKVLTDYQLVVAITGDAQARELLEPLPQHRWAADRGERSRSSHRSRKDRLEIRGKAAYHVPFKDHASSRIR
jgi:predicted helicase